ncbi:MAG: PASTA domain-containing protein [Clostridiales Family XIII bacterium]|nr:PASTA domain-containing protein [Clostridiales Family XIII bacterium]
MYIVRKAEGNCKSRVYFVLIKKPPGYTWDHSKYPSAPSDYSLSGLSRIPVKPQEPETPKDNDQPSQTEQPSGSDPVQPSQPTQTVETVRVFVNGEWKEVAKDSLEYVAIPDVVGMEGNEAKSILRAAGFSIGGGYDEYSDTVPYGHVIFVTDMGNGTVEKDGQTMTVRGALLSISVSHGKGR